MRAREILWKPPVAALVSAAATILSTWLLKDTSLPAAGRIAAALLAVPPLVFYLFVQLRAVRRRDELHQRVQLEALAIAFGGSLVLGLAAIQLRNAEVLPPVDPSLAWTAMVVLYIVGYGLSWRRYR